MNEPQRQGRLARIDERLVPRLAAAVRGTAGSVRRFVGSGGPPGRWVARTARRNPTIATAVGAVVVAAVLILATGGDLHRAVAPAPPNPQLVLPGNQLGPASGEQVSTYLAAVAERAGELPGTSAPAVTAVVDFNSYLTASAVQSVLAGHAGIQVSRAFVRVPPPQPGQVHAVTLASGSDLAQGLSRLAANARQIVQSYHKHVALAKRHPSSKNVQVVTAYAGLARQAKLDMTGLSATAGCVFALEVSGPPAQLEALAKHSDVRVLDPAPPTVSTSDLMVVPLEPQVTNIVPAPHFALQ
jgi:hypothetical protein